jgi:hypothetical protein
MAYGPVHDLWAVHVGTRLFQVPGCSGRCWSTNASFPRMKNICPVAPDTNSNRTSSVESSKIFPSACSGVIELISTDWNYADFPIAAAVAEASLTILLTTAFHDLLHLLQMVQVVPGIHPDKMSN